MIKKNLAELFFGRASLIYLKTLEKVFKRKKRPHIKTYAICKENLSGLKIYIFDC